MKNVILVMYLSCLGSFMIVGDTFAASKLSQAPSRLSNKSPKQLIELWDDASRVERRAIQEKLFDDISASIPSLRNKILIGTQKQKLFACAMIAEIRDVNSVPTLIKAIDDPDDKVKTRAISSLRRLKAKQAAVKIRQEIPKAKTKGTLKASLAALGFLGTSKDITILRTFLSDPDESVRVNASVAMALLGNYEGQNVLLAGTNSSNPGVKKEATYSLGFIGSAEAKNRLEQIMADPKGQWKSYARIALVQQELLKEPIAKQLKLLEETASNENQRVAEWAIEKIAGLEVPQGDAVLRKLEQNNTQVGRKAKRLLKIKEAK